MKGTGTREGGDVSNRVTALEGGERVRTDHEGYADPDGLETVEAWSCVEGCPVRELDRQSGELKGGAGGRDNRPSASKNGYGPGDEDGWSGNWHRSGEHYGDTGGASRFFYCAKSSRRERNAGLEGFEEGDRPLGISQWEGQTSGSGKQMGPSAPQRNSHPTVKPVDLMRWLCRLVTPPDGLVLDPFAGSGTTGIACVLEDFDFIGIEREPDYVEICRARIDYWAKQPKQLDLLGDAA